MPLTALLRPAPEHLPLYVEALRRGGWSPDNARPEAAGEHLAAIARDPRAFLAGLDDPEARGGPVVLPDGSLVPRLPGFVRWIVADGFCGLVNVRWRPGTPELPGYCLGHVGYAVVPWRRRQGYATRALGLLLAEAAPLGLPWLEVTCDPGYAASIRVIQANGGVPAERFIKEPGHGGGPGLRFRIPCRGPRRRRHRPAE